jgi:DNA topoisomerase-1
VPQDRGRLVIAFLEAFFATYVEYGFTAKLEEELDRVSNGEIDWKTVLREFWNAFHMAVDEAGQLERPQVLGAIEKTLEDHIFRRNGDGGTDPRQCPACAAGRLSLKLGKFGAFVGCSNYPECRFTRQLIAANGEDAGADEGPRQLGDDPDTGLPVSLRRGPYGPYVQRGEPQPESKEKPQRVALPRGTTPDQVTLEMALALLSLPRQIGTHPDDGQPVVAGIGRFGPYLKHGPKFVSLPKDDDVLSIGLNRAVTVIAENASKGGGRAGSVALKALGNHPKDGKPVDIKKGRYGPYVAHGRTFASLPKGTEVDDLTLDAAVELLAKKAGSKKAAAKAPAKAKKAPAKAKKAAPKAKKAAPRAKRAANDAAKEA